jgi:GNAT superfamily N-acetyltransferase
MTAAPTGPGIRRLRAGDEAALSVIRRRALEAAPGTFESGPDDDHLDDPSFVDALLADPRQAVFGAFDGPLVGFVGAMPGHHLKTAHRYDLWGLFVESSHGGRGLGRGLAMQAIEFVRSLGGASAISLSMTDRAPEASALYRSLGFVEWGRDPDAIRLQGTSIAEMHMRLDLE